MANPSFLSNVNLNSNQLLNAVVQQLGTDPVSPAEGQIWENTTSHLFKMVLNGVTITLGRLDQISAPTAAVALNAQKITGLGTGTASTDAASLSNKITDFAAPTTALAMNSQKITGLATGTAATDAATVGQVTSAAAGLSVKDPVEIATTTVLPTTPVQAGSGVGATLTAGSNATLTIDGYTVALNDRVLVKNESTGKNNGIYTVTNAGSGSTKWVLTRATDFDGSTVDNAQTVQTGDFVFVEQGTTNISTGWLLTTLDPTIDTTALTFSKFSAAPPALTKYTATGPGSPGTSWVVTHNLGSQDVTYSLRDASTNSEVVTDTVFTDTNTITFTFATSQSASAFKVTVVG